MSEISSCHELTGNPAGGAPAAAGKAAEAHDLDGAGVPRTHGGEPDRHREKPRKSKWRGAGGTDGRQYADGGDLGARPEDRDTAGNRPIVPADGAPRQLVHSEWFDHALAQLGDLPNVEDVLADEFHRVALYADLVRLVPGCRQLRVYQTRELLRGDGHVVRILIYFALRDRGRVVELQHIEAIEEEMGRWNG